MKKYDSNIKMLITSTSLLILVTAVCLGLLAVDMVISLQLHSAQLELFKKHF